MNIDPEIIRAHTIPDDLKLKNDQKKALRKALGSNTKIKDVHHALMKIKVLDLLKIIAEQGLDQNDNMVFYLASYRSQADIDRYKKYKVDLGSNATKIKFKPTLLVAGEKITLAEKDNKLSSIQPTYYDVATIKPPPEDTETLD